MILKNYTPSFHGQSYKMAKVSLLLLQCNLEELYTCVSWSKVQNGGGFFIIAHYCYLLPGVNDFQPEQQQQKDLEIVAILNK